MFGLQKLQHNINQQKVNKIVRGGIHIGCD